MVTSTCLSAHAHTYRAGLPPGSSFLGVIAQAQSTRGAVRVGDLLFAGLRAGPGRKAGALRRGCHVRQRGQVSVGAKWPLWNLGRGGLGRWRLRSQASRRVVPEGTLGAGETKGGEPKA